MSTLEHVTFSELQQLFRTLQLPADTRLTVTLEDSRIAQKALRRQKANIAMKKLRGSGNGNLTAALLKERERDALL